MSGTIGVSLKIDVTKINKDRLFQGAKGTYLDATVFINLSEKSEYGDNGVIAESVSKEERDSGIKGPILGNASIFWDSNAEQQPPQQQQQPQQQQEYQSPQYQSQSQQQPQQHQPVSAPDFHDDKIPF